MGLRKDWTINEVLNLIKDEFNIVLYFMKVFRKTFIVFILMMLM